MKVLFVCLGNICRSPMAEAIFKHEVEKENLNIQVDSAGTGVRRGGNIPHHGTQNILDSMDITYEGMVSRGLRKDDFENFDYLFAMDSQNYRDMKRLSPKEYEDKVFMFLEPIKDIHDKDIPDPWYTGNFVETQNLITRAVDAWIKILKDELS